MASLWKGCVNLFYSQVSRDKLPVYELNKGTLVYSQAEGQGPLRQISMIVITEATKSKSKKQFQHGVRIGSSLQQFPTVEVHSTILWFHQMDLSGSVCHQCQCFKCWDLSSFCSSFGNCLLYTCKLRNTELQTQEAAFQVKEFSSFLCMGRCKSQGSLKLFSWYIH